MNIIVGTSGPHLTGLTLRLLCKCKGFEGKVKGEMEVTRRRERWRKKLLDDLKDGRGYSHLEEEALDRTMWRNRFGRGFGPVVRQNTEWKNVKDAVFLPPLLTEIPGLGGVISKEFIKGVLAKVWKEMGILNPVVLLTPSVDIEVPLTFIEDFLCSVPICVSIMNSCASLNFCTFSTFCPFMWIALYFLQTYSTNTRTGI
jgi:hypothetical protein